MHKCECTFIIRIISFLQKSCFHEKISLYKIMSPMGIFWTIQTCFTILEFLECLLFGNLNDFSLKITEFTGYSQMQAYFFLQIIFYKNCIFTKKYFLHNYAYWEFFLDYIDLLYHFGMLKMSTLCTFQCFFTTAHQISAIETNVSVLFFQTGLMYVFQIPYMYITKGS